MNNIIVRNLIILKVFHQLKLLQILHAHFNRIQIY